MMAWQMKLKFVLRHRYIQGAELFAHKIEKKIYLFIWKIGVEDNNHLNEVIRHFLELPKFINLLSEFNTQLKITSQNQIVYLSTIVTNQ